MSVQTIPELFLEAVRERPRADCFSYRGADGKYVDVSSQEAHRRVRALRWALRSLGVQRGDRVVLLAENRMEWALADLAILCNGSVTVPIYPTLLPDTIEHIMSDCRPVAAFVSTPEQAAKVGEVRERLPFLHDVISFDPTDVPGVMPLAKLEQIGANVLADRPPEPGTDCEDLARDDLASIIYTSGTTGMPKGVMLSHWNFVSNVLAIREIVQIGPGDRCLSFLPLSHVLERTAGFFLTLYAGIGIAYAERMDTVPRDLIDVKPTIVVSVPRLYEKIHARVMATALSGPPVRRRLFLWAADVGRRHFRLRNAKQPVPGALALQHRIASRLVFSKLRQRTGGNLRFFVSGGAPLSAPINEFFQAAGLTILEGYGLTETAPVVAVNTVEQLRIGSVGPALPRTEIKIAEDGEILVRGPQVMQGYYNNEQATREVLSEDGWLATGDIGRLDADGFLFITDRKKDIIVTAGGKNVAPQPIENLLQEDRYVTQAVVIGDRRPYLTCLIVPDYDAVQAFAAERGLGQTGPRELLQRPEVQDLYQERIAAVNQKLPSFSHLRRFALLEHELTLEAGELTPTMKVKRFQVARRYEQLIDGLYPVESA